MTRLLPALLLMVLVFAACGDRTDESAPGHYAMAPEEFERWEIALVEMRIEKNEEFAVAERTPLRASDLPGFEGLNYSFPNAELRFRTPLVAAPDNERVTLTKRQGQEVPYVRKGHVAFSHDGKVHELDVFGPAEGDQATLWLPFYDATSGRETYAGGRYLDLEMDDEGMVDLDFNYAYNPLCDYNPDKFNCTLPPVTNRLDFAVEAGEKTFAAGSH